MKYLANFVSGQEVLVSVHTRTAPCRQQWKCAHISTTNELVDKQSTMSHQQQATTGAAASDAALSASNKFPRHLWFASQNSRLAGTQVGTLYQASRHSCLSYSVIHSRPAQHASQSDCVFGMWNLESLQSNDPLCLGNFLLNLLHISKMLTFKHMYR